jgi:4a-hydroxytetrahydrobiopterin dehydratase
MSTGSTEQATPLVKEEGATATPSESHDPTKPTINIPMDNKGTILTRDIVISSAVKKPSTLIKGLLELMHRSSETNDDPQQTTGTAYWTLESAGNAITRTLTFKTEEDAKLFRDRIRIVSDEMDHHAHMSLEGAEGAPGAAGNVTRMKITCTTHRPPGLSMRDVRLARKINELAGNTE